MAGLIHAPGPQGSIIELHAGQCEAGSNLHDYLLKSKQELDVIRSSVSLRGIGNPGIPRIGCSLKRISLSKPSAMKTWN